mmetsp:Transcript_40893/g.102974  ORF Transcript_40893/g.102974 Transcript_40893/m.102974 type:complete len:234 (+) Transcript_40893:1317-2018(+)
MASCSWPLSSAGASSDSPPPSRSRRVRVWGMRRRWSAASGTSVTLTMCALGSDTTAELSLSPSTAVSSARWVSEQPLASSTPRSWLCEGPLRCTITSPVCSVTSAVARSAASAPTNGSSRRTPSTNSVEAAAPSTRANTPCERVSAGSGMASVCASASTVRWRTSRTLGCTWTCSMADSLAVDWCGTVMSTVSGGSDAAEDEAAGASFEESSAESGCSKKGTASTSACVGRGR